MKKTRIQASCLIQQLHRCFGCVQLHLTACQLLSCLQPEKWWLQLLRAQSCQLIEWTFEISFFVVIIPAVKLIDKIKRECFGLSEFVLHEPGLPSAVAASLVYSGSSKQDFLSFGFPRATPMYNTMTELCNENGTRVSPVPGDRLYRVVGDLFWKLNPSWRSAPAFA